MRSYRDRQTNHIADLNEVRDDLPDIVWVAQERRRAKRVGGIRQEALCQVNVQHFSCHVPRPQSAAARFRKYINNGAGIGILAAFCLVLKSPDMAAIHILILAAIFSVLGVIAGALIYVLLSMVVSLLKIGLLLVAAVVVSGLLMRGCTPTIGKIATEHTSAMQIGLKPQIDQASSEQGSANNSDGVHGYKRERLQPR
jgi:hypothetical protein